MQVGNGRWAPSAFTPEVCYTESMKVNKALIWDYDWKPEEYDTEAFRTWYMARVLSNGTSEEVRQFDPSFIASHLEALGIPRSVKRFWEWWLRERGFLHGHPDTSSTGPAQAA